MDLNREHIDWGKTETERDPRGPIERWRDSITRPPRRRRRDWLFAVGGSISLALNASATDLGGDLPSVRTAMNVLFAAAALAGWAEVLPSDTPRVVVALRVIATIAAICFLLAFAAVFAAG